MLIPDWGKPKAIALVWPEHLGAGRGKLIEFYKKFIPLLSEHVPVKVLFSTVDGKVKTPSFLDNMLNVDIIEFPQIGDIWLRDYGPFVLKTNGTTFPIRGKYQPSYHQTDADKRYGNTDEEVGNKLSRTMYSKEPDKLKVGDQIINLDGGNFIHNGIGTAIVTNRIISDNEHVFIEDIRESLRKHIGIKELHIIPSEPGDDTGHADGLIRFLSPTDLIISEYPNPWINDDKYISEKEYKQSINCVESIAAYFQNGPINIHRMPNGIPLNSESFESAVGNYTNFLRVGELFFLPQYGDKEQDKSAKIALVKSGVKEGNIIPVTACNILAKEGGVLNCITTHIY